MGSTGRTNKRLTSLSTFTSPLVATTQGQQQQVGRKSSQSPAAVTGDLPSLHANGDTAAIYNFAEAEPRRDVEMGSDNDSEVCDLALDGALEDEALKNADALTEQEVARRRLRRINQLIKLYRMHYWGLLEELRSKYRIFYIKHGKGGWKDDADVAEREKIEGTVENADIQSVAPKGKLQLTDGFSGMKEPLAPDKSKGDTLRCAFQGCKSKPMALSSFCFQHILSEPRQQLYQPCSFVLKSI
ncbi:hypothetical protein KP509_34G019500 [Ceratopteris richardii]|uniref:KAT8 regulatory NSL complex subunit 2 n=1 Tax=Ceratopteris richardii TaxID=49495 RepID=A0A8T2QJ63_CERRI|nr:hypothetical protein KP509_34G019500 [Ceratopteris richardii]